MKSFRDDLVALTKCINDKWRYLAAGEKPKTLDCALCLLDQERIEADGFIDADDCKSCIIYADTGVKGCNGTPYKDWAKSSNTPKLRQKYAQQELEYLEGLQARLETLYD